MNDTPSLPALALIGDNSTHLWGMTNAERLRRLARAEGLPDDTPQTGARLYVNLDYVFDPVWLRHILTRPGTVVTDGGALVMAHLTAGVTPDDLERHRGELAFIDYRDNPQIYNRQLRKLDCPFIQRLTPATRRQIERKSYFGAYKGVTDLLTKYLWPELALWLTRLAASVGMTPNMVTAIGAALCVLATYLFSQGLYWSGMLAGFVFMVLDTVDGKLARCTITSSKWGNVFDHGIDLVHPPFWWYFWGVGLSAWGLALTPASFALVMAAVIAGYVLQRLIEGMFLKDFGMDIHVWRPFDSRFRLITARRNPNMVILFVATLFGRPDIGLIALAWWTVISLVVHAVRLAQAYGVKRSGRAIVSWMEAKS
ncbi:CDP-alcohol phosphatidyltransferase family protein [Sphingobium baderi]|uniref:Phosphatidylglycerophosphate synthase n=1 Tax=Sphingobium baderi LL03 TaxID=1114964 RepID=T0GRG8_9SPHN|nr:CDP-alcohol phosphatidyltransferase family protein [Sphingobium baderi]EQB03257.1 phosphatidylglycerophosphate synthase [Sphingobium baderi LL03]KMS62503.1 phosphatidylglycerophosphate synthase [Sphingobium baderi LL03]